MFKLALLQLTHKRVTDAKIGLELYKNYWALASGLKNIDIYHLYNGSKKDYPKKYIENVLIRRKNKGHFEGAADLIDCGIKAILDSKNKYDFIMVLSGDVWLYKPGVIEGILRTMVKKRYLVAATLWPDLFFIPRLFGTEFFIIRPELAAEVFPLNLECFFASRKLESLLYRIALPTKLLMFPKVEYAFTHNLLDKLQVNFWSFKWLKYIYLMPGRKLYFASNRFSSDSLGYYSHHDLKFKCDLLLKDASIRNNLVSLPTLKEFKI